MRTSDPPDGSIQDCMRQMCQQVNTVMLITLGLDPGIQESVT